MGFSWRGVEKYLTYKIEQRDKERAYEKEKADRLELYNRERQDKFTDATLPFLMERMKETKELAKTKEANYAKGKALYGAKVATALENTGQLADILENYKANGSPKEEIEVIVARTEDYLGKLAESDKPEDQEKLAKLLTRANSTTPSTLSDYISEVIADGVITRKELMGIPDTETTAAGDFGVVPNLGKSPVFTETQILDRAKEIAAALTPGTSLKYTPEGVQVVFGANSSSEDFLKRQAEVVDRLTKNQALVGGANAYSESVDYFTKLWSEGAEAPEPAGTIAPDSLGMTEAMSEAEVQPVITPEADVSETGWNPATLQDTQKRFNR